MTEISLRTAEERRQLRDRFRDILILAAKERNERNGIVETEHGPELEWRLYEEQEMLRAVKPRALPPQPPAGLRRAGTARQLPSRRPLRLRRQARPVLR